MEREKLLKNLIFVMTIYFFSFPVLGAMRIIGVPFVNYLGTYLILSFFMISTINLEYINKYYLLKSREFIKKFILPIEIFLIVLSLIMVDYNLLKIGSVLLVALSIPFLINLRIISPILYTHFIFLDFKFAFPIFYSMIMYLLFFEKTEKVFWKLGKRDIITLVAPIIYLTSEVFAIVILLFYILLKAREFLSEKFLERKISVSFGIFSLMTLFFIILASKNIHYWSPMIVFLVFSITLRCVLDLITLSRRIKIIKNLPTILNNTYIGIIAGTLFFALTLIFHPGSFEYKMLVTGISLYGLYYYMIFLRQLYF